MEVLDAAGQAALRPWFVPERPGPLVWAHTVRTGYGRCRVDAWPDPRAVLAELPGNYALRGDPDAPDLADLAGFVEAPPEWLPALRALDPGTAVWDRIVAVLPAAAGVTVRREVRRLGATDAAALAALHPDLAWIHSTWGGADGLAAAGVGWAAFTDRRPVSVAVPFYAGAEHEDIGVITDRTFRGRGLATACAAAVVGDIRARGRVPSWTTSPDNAGSLAVATRLGFTQVRDDVLYAVRVPIPSAD